MGGRGGASHRGTAATLINGTLGRDPNLPFGINSEIMDPMLVALWHENNTFNWDYWNSLSEEERQGITLYTDQLYRTINKWCRDKITPEEESYRDRVQKAIEGVRSTLSKFDINEDFVSWRGANLHWTANLLGIDESQLSDANVLRDRIGKVVKDKGFMSSAVTKEAAWANSSEKVTYKVYVRKGVSGMYVDPVSTYQGEKEFLFNAGTEFYVHEIETDSSGRIKSMVLEALPARKKRKK